MRKKKDCLCFVILGSIISLLTMSMGIGQRLSDGDKAYLNANAKAVKVLQQKLPIQCIGTGVGDHGGIDMMSLSFQATGEVNIEYARGLVLAIVEEYLFLLNSNLQFRPYMKNHPFDVSNLDVAVYFSKKNGYEPYDPYVGIACAVKGKLVYLSQDRDNRFKLNELLVESYEDAVEKNRSSNLN